jgi:hypothetical protein
MANRLSETNRNKTGPGNNAVPSVRHTYRFSNDGIGDYSAWLRRNRKGIFRKRVLRAIALTAVVASSMAAFFLIVLRSGSQRAWADNAAVEIPQGASDIFVNDVSGMSPAKDENVSQPNKPGETVSKSENYQAKEISIGGNAALFRDEDSGAKLEIRDAGGEALSSQNGSVQNVLIRWTTERLSSADVTYDNGGAKKKVSEGGFGYSHALLLSDLDEDKDYVFVIDAHDHRGNKASSEDVKVHTSKKSVSMFERITRRLGNMVNGALKK